MINNEKMQIALKSYKEAFSERWVDEKFKWVNNPERNPSPVRRMEITFRFTFVHTE